MKIKCEKCKEIEDVQAEIKNRDQMSCGSCGTIGTVMFIAEESKEQAGADAILMAM